MSEEERMAGLTVYTFQNAIEDFDSSSSVSRNRYLSTVIYSPHKIFF